MRLLQNCLILGVVLHQVCAELFRREGTQVSRVSDFNIPATTTVLLLEKNKQITRLYSGDFNGLNQVTKLDLSECEIDTIDDGAFQGLSALKILYLFFNKITAFPDLRGAPLLEELILHSNKIPGILPADVLVPENNVLSKIDLYGSELTGVADGFFSKLPKLKELILGSNKFTSVPNVHASTSLELLDLRSNDFVEIKAASFESQPAMNLKTLQISNRDSSPVDIEEGLFSVLPHLEKLQLDRMELTEVPNLQVNLGKLHTLELRQNKLTTLNPSKFFGNPINYNQESAMKTMIFYKNEISQIRGDFLAAFTNLETVQFLDNSLETFPMASLKNLENLRFVDIRSNKLTTIQDIGHSGRTGLRIAVARNPLTCDSRLCWLFQSGYKYYNRASDGSSFPCAEPVNKRTITWNDFDIDDLDCSSVFTTEANDMATTSNQAATEGPNVTENPNVTEGPNGTEGTSVTADPNVTQGPDDTTTTESGCVSVRFGGLVFYTTMFVLLLILT